MMNRNEKGIAAIWCRVSTHDQRELSLESQEIAVRRILEAEGYSVPPQYILKVDWTSLDLMACPQFQLLRQWITEGKVQAAGTLDRDRLQAQGLQRLLFLSDCRERGIRLFTVQGVPMLDGEEGQLVEMALALGKGRAVERAQQGARDGLRDRARLKGLPPTMNNIYGMHWENNRLVPAEHYENVSEIWRMALSGWKILAICWELGRRGILTPSGKRDWNTNTLRNMLKNRAYSGVIEALKQESIEPCQRRKATYGKTSRRPRPEDERVLLYGLVERPIVTKEEFAWVQQRLKDNQLFAKRNTRLREYLLKGLIRCSACGRTYVGVSRNGHSYYYCGAKWKPVNREACQSCGLRATEVEEGAFQTVTDFLRGPQGFENEIRRRYGLTEESEASIRRQITDLGDDDKKEQEAESRAFRLAAHTRISEEVFQQEIGLIKARRRWLEEERNRLQNQLADIERLSFSPEAVESLRCRFEERLKRATPEDQRFVLESLGAKVIAYPNGTWDMEIELPRPVHNNMQIEHSVPGPVSIVP